MVKKVREGESKRERERKRVMIKRGVLQSNPDGIKNQTHCIFTQSCVFGVGL